MSVAFESHGNLNAAGDTTVDSTTQNRWVRVRVYNADSVTHTITWKKASTPIHKESLASGDSREMGPVYVPSGTNVVVTNTEATTTTAPTFDTNGEY